jgi:uncharacterized protein YndB with AHSA1/START domain
MVLTFMDGSGAPGKSTVDSDIVDVSFTEIVPGERVVQAVEFVSDDPTLSGTMTMTWTVTAEDRGTLVEIQADNVPDGIDPTDHADGMASSLEHLATYLGS